MLPCIQAEDLQTSRAHRWASDWPRLESEPVFHRSSWPSSWAPTSKQSPTGNVRRSAYVQMLLSNFPKLSKFRLTSFSVPARSLEGQPSRRPKRRSARRREVARCVSFSIRPRSCPEGSKKRSSLSSSLLLQSTVKRYEIDQLLKRPLTESARVRRARGGQLCCLALHCGCELASG